MSDCQQCAERDRLLKIIADYEDQIVDLSDQLAGRERQLRRAGQAEVVLRRQLADEREAEDGADDIRYLLGVWAEATGRGRKGRKLAISASSKRGDIVRKALRRKNINTGKRYTVAELEQALRGLGLLPYVSSKGRRPLGRSENRYDEVEHALRDEPTIDRFIGYWGRASRSAAEQRDAMFRAWQQVSAEADLWSALVLGAVAAAEQGVEVADLEGHLRERFAADQNFWSELTDEDQQTTLKVAA